MKIEIIPCLSDNFSYLIHDKESNIVSIVDPAEYNACDNVIKKYEKLDFILNTHHHADHVDGNLELKKKYNSKILGFELDKDRIPGIDILLKENQKHKIGKLEFEVIFVPGHTKGHVAFFFFKEKVVFTGDTSYAQSVIDNAMDVDVLFYEAQANHMVDILQNFAAENGAPLRAKVMTDIKTYHTTLLEAAEIANNAYKNDTTLKEEAIKSGYLSAGEYDEWVNPSDMI